MQPDSGRAVGSLSGQEQTLGGHTKKIKQPLFFMGLSVLHSLGSHLTHEAECFFEASRAFAKNSGSVRYCSTIHSANALLYWGDEYCGL